MKRILDNKFDFNDFLSQYQAMNNMGGTKMMKLIPGFTQVWGGLGSAGWPYPINGTRQSVSQLGLQWTRNICAEQEQLSSDEPRCWADPGCAPAVILHPACIPHGQYRECD